jgi:hypothetical protein
MSLVKFASAAVLDARLARAGAGLVKDAHKHEFEYEPRPGFLYVRSRAISSRTNDNFDHFPAEEIRKAYKTFIGKPVFVNHHNDNHRRARGVIVDAALHEDTNPDGSEDVWTEVLMEVDAVRFPKLTQAILAGEIDRTSMGTDVEFSVCSVCNNKASTPLDYCQHIPRLKGKKIRRTTAAGTREDVLCYEKCYGLRFFENSLLVEEPADPTAFFLGVDDRGLQSTASRGSRPWLQQSIASLHLAAEDDEDEDGPQEGDPDFDESKVNRDSDGKFAPKSTRPRGKNDPTYPGDEPEPGAEGEAGEEDAADLPDGAEPYVPTKPPTGSGTEDDPIVTDDVEAAAQALLEDKHVRLDQPKTVSTLLNRLAEEVDRIKAEGGQASINLCNISVPGTNLFCAGNKGFSRIQMPQLASLEALPGSKAEALGKNDKGEYDIQPEFRKMLEAKGIAVSDETVPAANLKATQNELNGGKVAGMLRHLQGGGNLGDDALFISNDDYIIDGHHRWASQVAHDSEDGILGNEYEMPVQRIDVDIITLYREAMAFAEEWGIASIGMNAQAPAQPKAASKGDCVPCGQTRTAAKPKITYWVPFPDGTSTTFDSVREITWAAVGKVGEPDGTENYWDWNDPEGTWILLKASARRDLAEKGWRTDFEWRYRPGNPAPIMRGEQRNQSIMEVQLVEVETVTTASRTAVNEMMAPAQVDTLRDETCPVCGEADTYDGDKCLVCGFIRPPSEFMDPDLEKAQQVDLRQEDAAETVVPGDEAAAAAAIEDGADDPDQAALEGQPDGEDVAQPWLMREIPKNSDPDSDATPGEEDDEEEGEEDEDDGGNAPWKSRTRRKSARAITQKEQSMRPALKALAEQQKMIQHQARQIQALRGVVGFIAEAAGISNHPRVASLLKQAVEENPAQGFGWANPESQPAPEAPYQTTEEALGEVDADAVEGGDLTNDPTEQGATTVTDVSPDAQTSLDSNETVLDEPLDLNEQDPTRPVEGTDDLGQGGRGNAGTNRTETEVRAGDPNKPDVAFAETGWTTSKKSEGRTIASLRLARLRIQAGIERPDADDLSLGSSIAASEVTDEAIQTEIDTLAKVVTASGRSRQPVARNLVPQGARQAHRTTPSFHQEPQMPIQTVANGPSDDEFAFE